MKPDSEPEDQGTTWTDALAAPGRCAEPLETPPGPRDRGHVGEVEGGGKAEGRPLAAGPGVPDDAERYAPLRLRRVGEERRRPEVVVDAGRDGGALRERQGADDPGIPAEAGGPRAGPGSPFRGPLDRGRCHPPAEAGLEGAVVEDAGGGRRESEGKGRSREGRAEEGRSRSEDSSHGGPRYGRRRDEFLKGVSFFGYDSLTGSCDVGQVS